MILAFGILLKMTEIVGAGMLVGVPVAIWCVFNFRHREGRRPRLADEIDASGEAFRWKR